MFPESIRSLSRMNGRCIVIKFFVISARYRNPMIGICGYSVEPPVPIMVLSLNSFYDSSSTRHIQSWIRNATISKPMGCRYWFDVNFWIRIACSPVACGSHGFITIYLPSESIYSLSQPPSRKINSMHS